MNNNITTTERLLYTAEAVKGIHNAIKRKGVMVETTTPLADFEGKIDSIATEAGNEQVTISVSGLAEGVTVSAYYSGFSYSQDFVGEDLVFEIPVNEYYKINYSNISGYITPAPTGVIKAVAGYQREIEAVYIESEASTIYFDKTIASSINISGDVNTGAVATIRSNIGNCLAKPHPTIGGVAITMLSADDRTKYSDGTDAALDGSEGDVMVYMPEISYLSEYVDETYSRISISDGGLDGGSVKDPCLIAAYKTKIGDDGVARSISGVLPTASTSLDAFIAACSTKGEGWNCIHFEDHCMIALLFYAIYGTRHSQSVTGTGSLSSGSGLTGTTDSLGSGDTSANESGRANCFLGIEAFTGWYYERMTGATISNGLWTIEGLDGTSREYQAPTTSGWITKMLFEEGGSIDMIPTEVGGSDSTYYADYLTASTLSNRIAARSYDSTSTYGGVGYVLTTSDSSSASANYGSRLAFHGTITILEPDEYRAL